MYKELIISIIIILGILGGNVITQNHTKNSTNEINNDLILLKEKLKQESPSKDITILEIEKIYSKWEEMYHVLAYYIEHDELEKVNTELVSLKANIEVGQYDEAMPDLEKCIFILNHIKEKEALKIRNIF